MDRLLEGGGAVLGLVPQYRNYNRCCCFTWFEMSENKKSLDDTDHRGFEMLNLFVLFDSNRNFLDERGSRMQSVTHL